MHSIFSSLILSSLLLLYGSLLYCFEVFLVRDRQILFLVVLPFSARGVSSSRMRFEQSADGALNSCRCLQAWPLLEQLNVCEGLQNSREK